MTQFVRQREMNLISCFISHKQKCYSLATDRTVPQYEKPRHHKSSDSLMHSLCAAAGCGRKFDFVMSDLRSESPASEMYRHSLPCLEEVGELLEATIGNVKLLWGHFVHR